VIVVIDDEQIAGSVHSHISRGTGWGEDRRAAVALSAETQESGARDGGDDTARSNLPNAEKISDK
jgi:hypothetical protein